MLPQLPRALNPGFNLDFSADLTPDISQCGAAYATPEIKRVDHHCQICPTCGHRLTAHHCKLVCTQCGYYMSCADYY